MGVSADAPCSGWITFFVAWCSRRREQEVTRWESAEVAAGEVGDFGDDLAETSLWFDRLNNVSSRLYWSFGERRVWAGQSKEFQTVELAAIEHAAT